jgi:hypothetical protein
MHRPIALLLLLAPVAAGCGGVKHTSTTAQNAPIVTLPPQHVHGCSFLSTADVIRATGITQMTKQDLAPTQTSKTGCATVFVVAGYLLLGVAEWKRDALNLHGLRSMEAQLVGGERYVKPVPELGKGAFLARRRVLGFQVGERLVTLETGFTQQGTLELTPAQLVRLARVVGAHS